MSFASHSTLVWAAVLVLAGTSAQATVTCGTPVDNGGGQVDITVSTDGTFQNVSPQGGDVGLVTEVTITSDDPPSGTCGATDTTCTFSLQGTPGGGPQTWNRSFDDTGFGGTPCSVSDLDGLPVELLSFSVE